MQLRNTAQGVFTLLKRKERKEATPTVNFIFFKYNFARDFFDNTKVPRGQILFLNLSTIPFSGNVGLSLFYYFF